MHPHYYFTRIYNFSIGSFNKISLVENTFRYFTVFFIVIGYPDGDLYDSILAFLVFSCTICSNFLALNCILLSMAQLYIDFKSSWIRYLSSLHMTFLLTLVLSAKLLNM